LDQEQQGYNLAATLMAVCMVQPEPVVNMLRKAGRASFLDLLEEEDMIRCRQCAVEKSKNKMYVGVAATATSREHLSAI